MSVEIESYLSEKKRLIDRYLPHYLEAIKPPELLKEAMIYSIKAGGKRLRPILLLAILEAFGKDARIGMDAACALEMIHTYSLIHDDLPAMDDDDLRRGLPTNHKVYGEALAILAGDGLLTFSFECMAKMHHPDIDDTTKVLLISKLAQAAGPEGMVGGQADDLKAEGEEITLAALESIHDRKTGRLLSYAIEAGAILAHASVQQLDYLSTYAKHLGIAFQIQDDILDIEGNVETVGKPIGSDESNHKNTYPKLLSLQGAKEKLQYHVDQAKTCLLEVNIDRTYIEAITDYMIQRNH